MNFQLCFLTCSFIFLTVSVLSSQSFEEKFSGQDVQIQTWMELDGLPSPLRSKIAFNEKGMVTLIYDSALAHKEDHYAEYSYLPDGKIERELVFKASGNEERVIRETTYSYRGGSTLVNVLDADGTLIGEFIDQRISENESERLCLVDKLAFDRESDIHQSRTIFTYDAGQLAAYELEKLDEAFQLKLKIERDGEVVKATYTNSNDTSDYSFSLFHFYDDHGRLTHISGSKKRRKWTNKLVYGHQGLLSKVKGRGKMYTSGKNVRRDKIFDIKLSEDLELDAEAVKEINGELINLYYPLTGRMLDLNYLDSRRFISQKS